jgi:transposase
MTTHHRQDQEPSFAAFVGIDWADQKHDICLMEASSEKIEHGILNHKPEDIQDWVAQLRRRFGSRPVAICLEQARGPLVYALMKYEFLVLYPIAPKRLARYREAIQTTSGAKDDPTDAGLLLDYLTRHRDQLVAWKPDDAQTREIALLVETRRKFVDLRTRLSNTLKSCLKTYFPQAIELLGGDVTTRLACDFLKRWPSLETLQPAKPETLRKFYYGHNCRRGDRIEARIETIRQATPLVTDEAIVGNGKMTAQGLIAQLRPLADTIATIEKRLEELMAKHPDAALFVALPGAGDALAPRLLAAFGSDRNRFDSAAAIQALSGIAPVTKRSGKRSSVRRRLACPKFLKQTFHEFADHSRKKSLWARAYYDMQRAKQKGHHATIRALAFKWIRIQQRCWRDRTPYNETTYLEALRKRNSPLLAFLPSNS